jgi:Vam6/Vps39-like protein vacuolar protein sorting-associated protein 39
MHTEDTNSVANRYCRRKYQPNSPTSNIFFTLLRIYLRPTVKTNKNLLTPALDLISRHSPRLDEVATLELLPPLVTAQEVRAFLTEAVRAPVFDTHVVREIHKARSDQLARKLVALESKRVKVTDSRM